MTSTFPTGLPVYVVTGGAVVRKRRSRLTIEIESKVVASMPIHRVESVVLSTGAGATTGALQFLLRNDVPVVFLDGVGRSLGRLSSYRCSEPADRIRQYQMTTNPSARLSLAKPMVVGKLSNQRALLRRRNRNASAEVRRAITALADAIETVADATSLDQLRGIEGAAAGRYHRALRTLVPPECRGPRRDRLGRDLLSISLNYTSALLRETVVSAIVATGLDPQLSAFHQPYRSRPALAFDLMEEWRPALVESVALSCIGLRAITPSDLAAGDDTPGQMVLSRQARHNLVERFSHRLAASQNGTPRHQLIQGQAHVFRAALRLGGPPYSAEVWDR